MKTAEARRERRIIIIGCTGSIGCSTLEVISHLNKSDGISLRVVGLAAGSNRSLLMEQSSHHSMAALAIEQPGGGESSAFLATGHGAAEQLVRSIARPGDMVVAAIVGIAGLAPVIAALECGCDIALANKETLVAAGSLVMELAREKGCDIIPIDSEHNAIDQCLRAGRDISEVRRLILTASGGPFRTWSREQMSAASIEDALNHPTWEMGKKISIDSATMFNKTFEILEAHWLFGVPVDAIDVLIHPQSWVHSMVEFLDGSVIAHMGPPDMKVPIQYALTYPLRMASPSEDIAWDSEMTLRFEQVDHERFPSLQHGWNAIKKGGTRGAIINAANEVAVEAFLTGAIPFGAIFEIVDSACEAVPHVSSPGFSEIMSADRDARITATETVSRFSTDLTHAQQED